MEISRVVITGGPCAGKSTAMSYVQNAFTELGYTVLFVPETATELITGGVAPWTCGTNLEYQKCQMRLQLEKERIFLQAAKTMNADKILIVCDRGLLDKSTTKTLSISPHLRATYRTEWGETGSIEVGLHGGFNYQHGRNETNKNGNIDSWNFNYGGNLTLSSPWGTTLSTEIGPQYRRGYADENMNTTEIIWNAQLSHAFLKKKNLIVSAQWYDILGERSNISRNISATMRSDTETNAINSYVMFKVAYKLNLLGGRSAQGHGGRRGPGGGWGGHGGGRPFRM